MRLRLRAVTLSNLAVLCSLMLGACLVPVAGSPIGMNTATSTARGTDATNSQSGSLRVVTPTPSDTHGLTIPRSPLFVALTPTPRSTAPERNHGRETTRLAQYGNLPLAFEVNQGQTDRRVRFLARGGGYTMFLTATGATLALARPRRSRVSHPRLSQSLFQRDGLGANTTPQRTPLDEAVVRLGLSGANPQPILTGADQLPGHVNYFIGNKPSGWHRNVPVYGKVVYHDVYPGINLVYYGTQGQLEYDFQVAPNANPDAIRMTIQGTRGMVVDGRGVLVLHTALGDIRQRAPSVYQELGGRRVAVPTRYVLTGGRQVGFAMGAHDARRPLVIDPVLAYSTYLGGSSYNEGYGIAVDSAGDAYVTGLTYSQDFPTTPGSFSTTYRGINGNGEAFVAKLNPSGAALLYSTYLGGSNGDGGQGIAVDGAGDAYVTGYTGSSDFPTTPGAFSRTYRGTNSGYEAFVAKLNPAGSALLYSTYLRRQQ